jgi:GNAT superfamily N-acetyltransferase
MSSEFSPKVLELLGQSNKETVKIEPVSSGLVKNPTQEDPNYWKIAQDMFLSIPQGVVNAVEEQGDFLDENIVSLGGLEFGDKDGKLSFNDFIPRYVTPSKWKSEEYSKKRQLPIFHKPETLAGDMTEGVSRFITGFAGPAKFLKGAGLSGSLIKTSLRGLGAGAVADLTVFDPNEGRLSDMLVEFDSPLLNNAVTQYLASDESDSEMEGRLKNVLEGMALGGITESVFYGIKGWKKMRGVRDLDERAKIQKETSDVIDEIQNPKIKKVSEDLNISKEEKILKNIDDFEITSKKDYFSIVSKTKQLTKEYSGTPVTKKEKYIIQTEYSKKLNAMTVSDVKVSKEFRNTGVGKALYKIAIKDAFDKGLDFASDYSISESALRVYKSLEKEGFDIIYNKNVKTIKNEVRLDPERGKQIITTDKTDTMPVVIIKRKLKDIKIKSIKVRKFALEGDQGVNPKEALKIITKSKETAKEDSELWIRKVIKW